MWNYLWEHKNVTLGLVISLFVIAILMWILFESVQAFAAVIVCGAIGFGIVWLWQLGDE